MAQGIVTCPACNTRLATESISDFSPVQCPTCRKVATYVLFPATYRKKIGGLDVAQKLDGDSRCFNHPESKAVAICDVSGKFLCALCDIEIAGKHYAPDAVSKELSTGELTHLKKSQRLDDGIALGLSLMPLTGCGMYFIFFTAPIALVMGIYSIIKQKAVVPRGKWRAYLAIFFALLQILAFVSFIVLAIVGVSQGLDESESNLNEFDPIVEELDNE